MLLKSGKFWLVNKQSTRSQEGARGNLPPICIFSLYENVENMDKKVLKEGSLAPPFPVSGYAPANKRRGLEMLINWRERGGVSKK